jgi:hypothetical protein
MRTTGPRAWVGSWSVSGDVAIVKSRKGAAQRREHRFLCASPSNDQAGPEDSKCRCGPGQRCGREGHSLRLPFPGDQGGFAGPMHTSLGMEITVSVPWVSFEAWAPLDALLPMLRSVCASAPTHPSCEAQRGAGPREKERESEIDREKDDPSGHTRLLMLIH